MRAYSENLRERIVGAVEQGKHPSEVAELFKVSVASIGRYIRQKRDLGHLRSQLPPGRPRILSKADEDVLLAQLKTHADASLEEHTQMLNEISGKEVSLMSVQRTFVRLGITRKKDKASE